MRVRSRTSYDTRRAVCRSYSVFDFVWRHYRGTSKFPLHAPGRASLRHFGDTGRHVDHIRRGAHAAMAKAVEQAQGRRLFGTWNQSVVRHLPLGPYKAFVPLRPGQVQHGRFMFDPEAMLLGPPKPASRRKYLVSFAGNRHPLVSHAPPLPALRVVPV